MTTFTKEDLDAVLREFAAAPPPPNIIFLKPIRTYRIEYRYKKHRKKKRICRVKAFAGFQNVLNKGQYIIDEVNNVCYINENEIENSPCERI